MKKRSTAHKVRIMNKNSQIILYFSFADISKILPSENRIVTYFFAISEHTYVIESRGCEQRLQSSV